MTARAWFPLGFLLLMVGFGLRLDSGWQATAWLVLLLGAAAVARGAMDSRAAFVPRDGGR